MSSVSRAICRRFATDMMSMVRMLCVRSASLTMMTRRSRTIASSILRKDSGLRFLAALELDLVELGDAVDDLGDVLAELLRDLLLGDRRVLDDVVQDRPDDRVRIEVQLGEDLGRGDRMG